MSAGSEAAARPAREAAVAWRVIDGEAVMVVPATGKVHTLNRVGTRFWELVDGSRSVEAIAEAVAAEFDAPAEQIARDCRGFAEELRARGLIRVEG